jgi:SAM-dependent methyltransferase
MMSDRQQHAVLADRHEAEKVFHDQKFGEHDHTPRHYDANPTAPVFDRMLTMAGRDLTGKRVLEYGCGEGWITADLAERGARVSAFDISPVAVQQARDFCAKRGVGDRCTIEVMAGEKLTYPDESFDIVTGFAILHHLELTAALKELRRVLAPGGRAYFAEPLGSNPLINTYRRLTPQYRTPDEKPIDLTEFTRLCSEFSGVEHHDQLLLASGALALCYVPGLRNTAAPTQRFLMRVDDVVLKVAPWAGRWAWYSILVMKK